MNENIIYNQEIDLKDMMFSVFHKWKLIIATALGLAILLGGFRFVRTYTSQNSPTYIQEAQEQYADDLELYENTKATTERELDNLRHNIEKQQEYLSESILMNMSPYDVYEASADLYVKTNYEIMPGMTYQNSDYTDSVLQAYQSVLTSASFLEGTAKQSGLESQYLQELVSVKREMSILDESELGSMTNLLTLKVQASSQKEAENLLKGILTKTASLQASLSEKIGPHTITALHHSVGTVVDLTLADRQQEESKRLVNLQASLEEKEAALKDLKEPAPYQSSTVSAVKSGIKYGFFGALLGGFICVFFACAIFLMSDKLNNARELRRRFNLKILGELSKLNSKKVKGIDAWLNRLEGHNQDLLSEQQYDLIAANVRNYSSSNLKTLLVTGTITKEQLEEIQRELSARLSGVTILAGENPLISAETLKKLPQCDGVILAEECGSSLLGAIQEEAEVLQDAGKEIVGCITLG